MEINGRSAPICARTGKHEGPEAFFRRCDEKRRVKTRHYLAVPIVDNQGVPVGL